MAVILWILFKVTLRQRMIDDARRQAERGVFGSTHEAHGEMDMSITDGTFLSRVFSPRAFTAISHTFYLDLNALYLDIGLGFLIAGALAAWVPNSWWQAFFLTNHPTLNAFWRRWRWPGSLWEARSSSSAWRQPTTTSPSSKPSRHGTTRLS
jgi:uncharacterized membrane protein YraQ (UPF0718 family)